MRQHRVPRLILGIVLAVGALLNFGIAYWAWTVARWARQVNQELAKHRETHGWGDERR